MVEMGVSGQVSVQIPEVNCKFNQKSFSFFGSFFLTYNERDDFLFDS